MSFQGDVAGIGLGELLQGLSRGGRDGVLNLYGKDLSASIGLHAGQLFLLPGPDETEEMWRDRSAAAFAADMDIDKEKNRRDEIAAASRLECVYQMLEAPNLHFRFEPGALPPGPGARSEAIALDGSTVSRSDSNGWGRGLTVEYMLLEHARVSDEANSGAAALLRAYDVPRALDAVTEQSPELRDFLEECNGSSTLQEIADRLGWPLMQCRNTVGSHIAAGNLRMSPPRELLASAQRELEAGRALRAASRLTGWIRTARPGRLDEGDASLLSEEWNKGRLVTVFHLMKPTDCRAMLRRLDRAMPDSFAARERWTALYEAHRRDEISVLRSTALRLVATDDPEARTFHDLLRLARTFQDRGMPWRTRTVLRLAAGHMPSRPQTRMEIGKRMLETGLVAEGTRWLLNTAHQFIEMGDPERALGPIRIVLRDQPENGEAGSLQIHARTLLANRKKRKVHVVIGASVGLVLALVAVVRYRSYRAVEYWVAEMQSYVGHPEEALDILAQEFGDQPPERIVEVRTRLTQILSDQRKRAFEAWRVDFLEIEDACRFGDPLFGLRRVLELQAAPGEETLDGAIPQRQDLLGVIATRFGTRAKELDLPPTAPLEELNQEQHLVDVIEQAIEIVDRPDVSPEVVSFHFRLQELHEQILERREARSEAREVLTRKDREKQEDIMLATARAHATAGDLERALIAYERLLTSDPELRSIPLLQEEIDGVQRHFDAVKAAEEKAAIGDHDGAAAELKTACPRPLEHLLPYHIDSRPSGARVTLPDGRVRTTPFEAKSGVGEVREMVFTLPGFGERRVTIDRPRNLVISLFREPEREWKAEYTVEAIPVPVGADHIVADRRGTIRRLDPESNVKWERHLSTLGGIARTPTFLPERPGHLLVIAEDGKAWLVDASTGEAKGPRDIGSPPVAGPVITRSGATVSFADGRVGVWTDKLEPVFYQNESLIPVRQEGSESMGSTMLALRRSMTSDSRLRSSWNDWTVEILPDEFRVLDPDRRGFAVERTGDWSFVAWESPKVGASHGRVWVSDEAGLRSFVPTTEQLVSFD